MILPALAVFILTNGSLGGTNARTEGVTGVVDRKILDPQWGVGSWIWGQSTFDKQTCRFWRAIEIPANAVVNRARLRIAADNNYRLLLDGREIGRGSDWKYMTEYDLTWLLSPGTHVFAIEAFNEVLEGGILLGLRVEFVDGRTMEVGSDANWRVVPEGERKWEKRKQPQPHWPKATVAGAFGAAPWNTKPSRVTLVPPLRPVELRFWQTGWFQIVLLSICAGVVLICLRLAAKLALQSKAQELLGRERARIARDIHDELGSGLTRLVLLGEVVQSDLPPGSEKQSQIEQLCSRARSLLGTIDEVIWAVNSRRDTLRDFASHVCKYAQSFLEDTPIRCRLDLEADMPDAPFDLPIRRNLFLSVKEAISNAAKHSQATELFLRIHRVDESLLVVVEDNGRGFDVTQAKPDRNGLTNMRQRMSEIGGTCEVICRDGKGCCVEFKVPLKQTKRRWRGWTDGLSERSTTSKRQASSEPKGVRNSEQPAS